MAHLRGIGRWAFGVCFVLLVFSHSYALQRALIRANSVDITNHLFLFFLDRDERIYVFMTSSLRHRRRFWALKKELYAINKRKPEMERWKTQHDLMQHHTQYLLSQSDGLI